MKKVFLTCFIITIASLNIAQAKGLQFEKNMEQKINNLIIKINNSSTNKSKKFFEKKLQRLLKKIQAKKLKIVFPRI